MVVNRSTAMKLVKVTPARAGSTRTQPGAAPGATVSSANRPAGAVRHSRAETARRPPHQPSTVRITTAIDQPEGGPARRPWKALSAVSGRQRLRGGRGNGFMARSDDSRITCWHQEPRRRARLRPRRDGRVRAPRRRRSDAPQTRRSVHGEGGGGNGSTIVVTPSFGAKAWLEVRPPGQRTSTVAPGAVGRGTHTEAASWLP